MTADFFAAIRRWFHVGDLHPVRHDETYDEAKLRAEELEQRQRNLVDELRSIHAPKGSHD